ncbi:MAG: hypothetical protein EVA77_06880 [Phycisphaeraceae bacterium]|nr:MAG: hypothetical protein EVA77_06880 [Phycisphaeraceae bacterium]
MRFALSTVSTLAVASVALGQEYPDPNPVPQADGTNLWYVGNNTQYPVIQDVLDAVSDGDEVVVRGGLYVESLHIDNNEITMRPFVSTSSSANGTYEHVTFLNPTEGFNNDNGYAMKLEGGRGTYIGIPRQFTELSNGLDVQTKIIPRNPDTYAAGGDPTHLIGIVDPDGAAFEFRSRSLDDVAIWSNSGKGTFKSAYVTSQQGLGGGIMATGADNQTMFVNVTLEGLYATGATHDESGEPVCVVNVTGDMSTRARFHNCTVRNNDSAGYGVVYMNGADTEWILSSIGNNDSRAADGTIMAVNGRGTFDSCFIAGNESGRGTFHWDANGTLPTDEYRLNSCLINDNSTVTGLYGGVAWVDHAGASGENPQISLSDCCLTGNNGLGFPNATDPEDSYLETDADYAIHTPYMPEYRIGMNNYDCGIPAQGPEADLNNDGNVDESDLDTLYDMLGMCRTDIDASGEIDFNDLLNVLVDFGNTCE